MNDIQRMRHLAGINVNSKKSLNESIENIPGLGKPIDDKKMDAREIADISRKYNSGEIDFKEFNRLMQSYDTTDYSMHESAPPGMEDWVKSNKQRFIDQYGKEKGLEVLYATAWKNKNKSESVNEAHEPSYHSVFVLDDHGKWNHHFDADDKEDARIEAQSLKNQGEKTKIFVVPKSQADWRRINPDQFVRAQLARKVKEENTTMMEDGQESESEMQTQDTVGRNQDYAQANASLGARQSGEPIVAEDDEEDIEEAYDFNNGYNDRHQADEEGTYPDFGFPNGADSPVVKSTGASGARQGDNPEYKKMAVTEDIYSELVYKYRSHLKESGDELFSLKKKLSETGNSALSVELDPHYPVSDFKESSTGIHINGPIFVAGTALDRHNKSVRIEYSATIVASCRFHWENDEQPVSWDYSSESPRTQSMQYVIVIDPKVSSVKFTENDDFSVDNTIVDKKHIHEVLDPSALKSISDPNTYVNVLNPWFDKKAEEIEPEVDE